MHIDESREDIYEMAIEMNTFTTEEGEQTIDERSRKHGYKSTKWQYQSKQDGGENGTSGNNLQWNDSNHEWAQIEDLRKCTEQSW